jgi:hypothetical protein
MARLTQKMVEKPAERIISKPDLKSEQEKTLKTPLMEANLILKMLFLGMDLIYGSKRTLLKFRVIEILARYPYWAWEISSYNRLTRMYARTRYNEKKSSDTAIHYVELGRKSQDNEQWHMLIIEDIMRQKRIKQGWVKTYLIPRILSLGYLGFTRLLFRLKPEWSFAMNAKFESHAEHEYMLLVKEHPEWEDEPVESKYFQYYPRQSTMADLFRRIGLDEREHKEESMKEYERLTGKTIS